MKYNFQSPDGIFRGTDFWMLNDKLDAGEIVRQITAMHEQGVNSFIARTYIGLRSDYPGEEFMGKMAVILETAKKFGMKVFLQAGYMPEAIPGLRSDCALHYIIPKKNAELKDEDVVFCAHGEYSFTDVNSVTFLDMFSRESVAHYLLQSYEKMWERFSDYYGKTALSVWVDEPSYNLSYLPYTPKLAEVFEARWGYTLNDKLWMLFIDEGDFHTLRYHYWLTLEELLEHNYFEQIRDWCHAHNLWFSGHLMMEDNMRTCISRACSLMPYYKYFDMPGMDILCAEMNWRYDEILKLSPPANPRYVYANTPMQLVSAANQAGKTHILAEMYGVSSQNFNFRDQRQMFDHFASLGVNHRCVHGMFYSLHGRGKRAYPPHVNYYQPYWSKYHLVTDYVARTSAFITCGKPVRDTLLLHPLETAYTLYRGTNLNRDMPELDELDKAFYQVNYHMLRAQIPFDMGDEITLRDWGKVTPDGLQVGEMTYKTVVVPYYAYIRESTLKLLDEYQQAGGKVIFVGRLPDHVDGKPVTLDPAKYTLVSGIDPLRRILLEMPRDLHIECDGDTSSIQVNHRREGGVDYIMLFNTDCREARPTTLTFDCPRRVMVYDAQTGDISQLAASASSVDVVVPEGASVLLTAERVETAASIVSAESAKPVVSLTLDGGFTVERDTPNALLLEYCQYKYKADDDWSPIDYPALAIHEKLIGEDYNGEIFLRFAFESAVEGLPLQLALEDSALQQITFNGESVDNDSRGRWFRAVQFQIVDLPNALKKGMNIIEIRREFHPLKKALNALTSLFENLGGVELENMYLLGDFSVKTIREPSNNGTTRYSRSFLLDREQISLPGMIELTSKGYPFYAGGMSIRKTFDLPAEMAGKRVTLNAEGFHGCNVEVVVNGISCGDLCWHPYTADITKAVREGENTLELRIVCTLRNLLGPWHRPSGEIGNCWGSYQTPNKPWLGIAPDNVDWYEHREVDTPQWAEGYFLLPLGIEKLVLEAK